MSFLKIYFQKNTRLLELGRQTYSAMILKRNGGEKALVKKRKSQDLPPPSQSRGGGRSPTLLQPATTTKSKNPTGYSPGFGTVSLQYCTKHGACFSCLVFFSVFHPLRIENKVILKLLLRFNCHYKSQLHSFCIFFYNVR